MSLWRVPSRDTRLGRKWLSHTLFSCFRGNAPTIQLPLVLPLCAVITSHHPSCLHVQYPTVLPPPSPIPSIRGVDLSLICHQHLDTALATWQEDAHATEIGRPWRWDMWSLVLCGTKSVPRHDSSPVYSSANTALSVSLRSLAAEQGNYICQRLAAAQTPASPSLWSPGLHQIFEVFQFGVDQAPHATSILACKDQKGCSVP